MSKDWKTMTETNKPKYLFLSLLAAFLTIAFMVVHKGCENVSEGFKTSDTIFVSKIDTLYKTDTLTMTKLVPMEVEKIRVDTVYSKEGEPIEMAMERKKYEETVIRDQDTARVTVYASGIGTEVDSLSLIFNRREIIRENTLTMTNTVIKRKRFHVSPQVGVGYGVFGKRLDAYVGVGIGFDF